jgi:hypothetical protein
MDEYLLFYKDRLPISGKWGLWDVFISAFNSSERVAEVASRVRANERHWLILPEYGYSEAEHPAGGRVFANSAESEADYLCEFVAALGSQLPAKRVVVDITGFVGHYVIALMDALQRNGVETVDVIYAEPARYLKSERTRFSDEAVMDVRQVAGFEGVHTPDTTNDLLVLAVGYDYRLVAEVANYKEHAKKVQLFGLPSLRPDMYQESLLRASKVTEAVGPDAADPHHFQHAPAHDPFVTASVISTVVREHRKEHPRANVYLSPLSTKAQALGFALFYLRECRFTATSVLYPFCKTYARETSEGMSGAWLFRVELARLRTGVEQ